MGSEAALDLQDAMTRGMLLLLAGMAAIVGCPRDVPPVLPAITSDNPQASAELEEAQRVEESGDFSGAAERYTAFQDRFAGDPLVAVAQLRLGRIRLSEGALEEADALLRPLEGHSDEVLAERARFYFGVSQHLQDRHEEALSRLEPLRGRTIDPEETSLLYRTLGAAYERLERRVDAVVAYDRLVAEASTEEAKADGRSRIQALLRESSNEELDTALEALEAEGFAFAQAATRRLRTAFDAGDLQRVAAIAERMEAADIELDAELRAMTLRAERTGRVDPRAIGAVLPLSGRGQEVGQDALWAMMMAASLPLDAPPGPQTPRVVFRDSGGDADRAAAAVSDLVTLHQVSALVGPPSSAAGRAAAARAQELGVPYIALAPDDQVTDLGEMVFRGTPTLKEELRALMAASGATRIAVVHPSHAFGQRAATTATALATELGLPAPRLAAYDAPHQLRDTLEGLRDAPIEAFILPDAPEAVAQVAPALAAVGFAASEHGPRLLLPSVAFGPQTLRRAGRYLQGAIVVRVFDPARSEAAATFAAEFESRHGRRPNLFAATAYDLTRWLLREASASEVEGSARRPVIAQGLVNRPLNDAITSLGSFEERRPRNVGLALVEGDALRFDWLNQRAATMGRTRSPFASARGADGT
ncbi:MAG: ABC transporter substrate-binding protein [Myxococcota bacterium]